MPATRWSLGAYPRHAQASSEAYKYDADVVKHIVQHDEAYFSLGKHVTGRCYGGITTKWRATPVVISSFSGLRVCLFSMLQILRLRAQAS
jgi:hypothetical protein